MLVCATNPLPPFGATNQRGWDVYKTYRLNVKGLDEAFVITSCDWRGDALLSWRAKGQEAYNKATIPCEVVQAMVARLGDSSCRSGGMADAPG
jgi:hypothetical protein